MDTSAQRLDLFLSKIFNTPRDSEHVVLWATTGAGVQYPTPYQQVIQKIDKGDYFSAYYGTSTMKAQPDGKVFNRQGSFMAYYVVVLDDVGKGKGAKTPFDSLPPAIRENYSYMIESSPDNFQIGLVLDEPIIDLAVAKQLQRDVIIALGTDSGGMLINKAVRLPLGYNLKTDKDGGYKYLVEGKPFQCRLVEFRDKRWDAEELRKAAGVATNTTVRTSQVCGTAMLNNKDAHFIASKGIIDPVYEWLVKSGMVYSEGVDWVTIECPFADGHTDPNQRTAGYSPLGYGDQPQRRGFHCFHDSCSKMTTHDFLTYVYQLSGIRAAVYAGVSEYVARYAFSELQNSVIDVVAGDFSPVPITGFKNRLSKLVPVPAKKGETFDRVSEYVLYSTAPNRLDVHTLVHRPGEPLLIPRGDDAALPNLNVYRQVSWPHVEPDMTKVQPFIDFINYLCPDGDDAQWVLSHIAAKAQNVKYRGLGVIMSTPVEGTGRGTLERIIRRLWSIHNVNTVSLPALLAGAVSADNNMYMLADWIIVSEAKDIDITTKQEFRSYESLKQFIELNEVELRIKEKWLKEVSALCYGSVMIFSQHSDVIPGDLGTTRFRRILNTRKPQSKEKWMTFYDWIENSEFEPHLWSWLLQRDISQHETVVRSNPKTLREEVIAAIQFERAIPAALALCLLYADTYWDGLLHNKWCCDGMAAVALKLHLDDIPHWEKVLKKQLVIKTYELSWTPRVKGVKTRLRSTPAHNGGKDLPEGFCQDEFTQQLIAFVEEFYSVEGL